MKILFEAKHLQVVNYSNSKWCLIVEDTEVNEYVEDFLYDNFKIQADDVELDNGNSICKYYNYFESVTGEDLIKALMQIDHLEVERVFRINN